MTLLKILKEAEILLMAITFQKIHRGIKLEANECNQISLSKHIKMFLTF